MGFEDEYVGRGKKKNKGINRYLPILGLLLAIVSAVIGYIVGPGLATWAGGQFHFEPTDSIQWVFRGVVFVVVLGITAALLAMATPKPKSQKMATEQALAKERDERRKEQVARKKRQREINREMARQNEERNRR